jgi:hypothetical protein
MMALPGSGYTEQAVASHGTGPDIGSSMSGIIRDVQFDCWNSTSGIEETAITPLDPVHGVRTVPGVSGTPPVIIGGYR